MIQLSFSKRFHIVAFAFHVRPMQDLLYMMFVGIAYIVARICTTISEHDVTPWQV